MPKVDYIVQLLKDVMDPLPFTYGTVVHSKTEFMVVAIIVFFLTMNL